MTPMEHAVLAYVLSGLVLGLFALKMLWSHRALRRQRRMDQGADR